MWGIPGQENTLFKILNFEKFVKHIKKFGHLTKKIIDHYETLLNYPLNQSDKINSKANNASYIIVSRTVLVTTVEKIPFS